MATTERQFVYRGPDGAEHGPITQQGLTRLAKTGKVTAFCQVRSTLIPKWEHAKNVAFLAEIIAAQTPASEQPAESELSRIWRQMTLRAPETKLTGGILQARAEDYETAPMFVRLASGIVDCLILLGLWITVYLVMAAVYRVGVNANLLFYLGLIVAYTATLLYYTLFTCFGTHQTPGQKAFNLVLIKKDGCRLLLGRCFAFAALTVVFGLITPFSMFVTPTDRGLQDIIAGVRVVKHRILARAR